MEFLIIVALVGLAAFAYVKLNKSTKLAEVANTVKTEEKEAIDQLEMVLENIEEVEKEVAPVVEKVAEVTEKVVEEVAPVVETVATDVVEEAKAVAKKIRSPRKPKLDVAK